MSSRIFVPFVTLCSNQASVTGPPNSVSLLLRVTPSKIANVCRPCYGCYGCYGFLERGMGIPPNPVRHSFSAAESARPRFRVCQTCSDLDLCKLVQFVLEPMAGIEPATDGLRNRCSTAELHWHPSRRRGTALVIYREPPSGQVISSYCVFVTNLGEESCEASQPPPRALSSWTVAVICWR